MASFTNFATLSYNGGTTNSNIVTGEILEALTAVKTAVSANYSAGDRITYALSLVNTGTAAITDYTVTDNLGGYTVGANTVYPLAYNAGTVRYYINGVLQAAPTVTAGRSGSQRSPTPSFSLPFSTPTSPRKKSGWSAIPRDTEQRRTFLLLSGSFRAIMR